MCPLKPSGCFSLREHLERQGVTTKESMREHLSFIWKTLTVNPSMDIRAYRVNPEAPDQVLQG